MNPIITLRRFLLHLRLPMQFLLAPVFLLGAQAGGGRPGVSLVVAFLAVHVGLYGGATAYNSFHDRDEGPIAFRKRPQPVTRRERDAALALQGAAVLVVSALSLAAGALCLALLLMGIAYSHPRWRWKASTAGALAAVALGQGAGAFYLGFFAAGGDHPAATAISLRAAGAALVVAGIYPITQVYQVAEDRRRGDRTLPVRVGWKASFVFSVLACSAGLLLLGEAMADQLPPHVHDALPLAPIALAAALLLWSRRFERQDAERNHDWAMVLGAAASLFFFLLLGLLFFSPARGEEGAPAGAPEENGRHVAEAASSGEDAPGGAHAESLAAATHQLDIRSEHDTLTIDTSIVVPEAPGRVWPVVLDYDGLAGYMPNVDSSHVTEDREDETVVRQVGSTSFLFVPKTLRFELVFHRRDAETVEFHELDGDFQYFAGTWTVAPVEGGSRIAYHAAILQSLPFPGFLVRHVVRRDARRMMPALAAELARRRDADAP